MTSSCIPPTRICMFSVQVIIIVDAMCRVITNCVFFRVGCEATKLFRLRLHSSDISDQLLNPCADLCLMRSCDENIHYCSSRTG